MTLVFRHPKYYKELRKLRNNSDQVISKRTCDGESERAPGPGLKRQASSNKLKEIQASSGKHQAPSTKVQAPSRKRQAPGPWILEKVSG
jgi:hypothetical protein